MEIPCVGGQLDGMTVTKDDPEQTIYQNGLWLVRVHSPYPKKKGERITKRLMVYTDTYALVVTEGGPIYRCDHSVAGLFVGDEKLTPSEGGGYDIWIDAEGKQSAHPPGGAPCP